MGHEPTKTEVGLTERDKVALFIGSNAKPYLELYDQVIAQELDQDAKAKENPAGHEKRAVNAPASFNFAALLVTPFWLFYRKLYVWAFGWTIVSVIISYLFESVFPSGLSGIGGFIWFVAAIAAAVFFDNHYVAKARKAVSEIEAQNLAHEVELYAIRRAGGTSPLSVWMYVLFIIGWGVTNFAYTQYVDSRTLTDCYDDSLNPVAEKLVLQELDRLGVQYQSVSVRAGDNIIETSTDSIRYCMAFADIDGEDVLLTLDITWQYEVGGPKDYKLGDYLNSFRSFLETD